MAKKQEYEFSFCVEKLTAKQAKRLMDVIVASVEGMGTYVGGGYNPVTKTRLEQMDAETTAMIKTIKKQKKAKHHGS